MANCRKSSIELRRASCQVDESPYNLSASARCWLEIGGATSLSDVATCIVSIMFKYGADCHGGLTD